METADKLYKMGIKLLDDNQLENVFPEFSSIMEKFNICRSTAKSNMNIKKGHYQYNLMYDNVFSIMGNRGTGKTSVLFTIRKKLEDEQIITKDIVFPVIIPEIIPHNCSVLGWILATIGDVVQEIENSNDRNERFLNCRNNSNLTKKYNELVELCFSAEYNSKGETSFYDAISNAEKRSKNYYAFMKKMDEFWDLFIEKIKETSESKDNAIEPMIYFFFDDVDLAPDKVDDLLSTIIRYLSHPNVIVVTTADEELFLEVIQNQFNLKMGNIQEKREKREFDRFRFEDEYMIGDIRESVKINETARLYLGKVLPSATRYYLELFDRVRDKEQFLVSKNGKTLLENIYQKMKILDKNPMWLKYGNEFIGFYLNFFGNTSRQIMNAYLILCDFIDKVAKNKKSNSKFLYKFSRKFLHSAIVANNDFVVEINNLDEFLDNVLLRRYDGWDNYIDYYYVLDYFMEKKQCINCIYSLLIFLEHILLCVEGEMANSKRKKVHGLYALANYYNEYIFHKNVVNPDLSEEEFLYHYELLFERSIKRDFKAMNKKRYIIEFFNSFAEETESGKLSFIKSCNNKWVQDILEMATILYSGIYKINEKNPLFSQEQFVLAGKKEANNFLRQYVIDDLCGLIPDGYKKNLQEKDFGETLKDYRFTYVVSKMSQKDLEIIELSEVGIETQIEKVLHNIAFIENQFSYVVLINKTSNIEEFKYNMNVIRKYARDNYGRLTDLEHLLVNGQKINRKQTEIFVNILKEIYATMKNDYLYRSSNYMNDEDVNMEVIQGILNNLDYYIEKDNQSEVQFAKEYWMLFYKLSVLYSNYFILMINKNENRDEKFKNISYYKMYKEVEEFLLDNSNMVLGEYVRLKNIIVGAKIDYLSKYIK